MNGVRNFLRAAASPNTSSTPPDSQSSLTQPPLSHTSPLKPLSGPSWPPSPTQASIDSPKTTQALFFKKNQNKPQPQPPLDDSGVGNSSFRSSTSTTSMSMSSSTASTSTSVSSQHRRQTSSPPTNSRITALNGRNSSGSPVSSPRTLPSKLIMKECNSDTDWKRSSSVLNTRDELLMSLLASQAVVDSRDFDILGSEEVDELKKAGQKILSVYA